MELKIDAEFESQIPPLTDEEYIALEENILSDGLIINPLIVWGNVIVDGHNRYRVVQRHPDINFSVFPKEFQNRSAAIAWICHNQLGRRNLTAEQKKYLIGKQYDSEKASHGGERNTPHKANGQFTASSQFGNLRSKEKTCERIANENGISKNTVLRAENYAKAVDIVDKSVPGTRKRILSGEIKPTDKEIRAMASAAPEMCAEMVKELKKPKTERTLLRDISEKMLHAQSEGNPDTMLYEMNDALDSLIFRWDFCFKNYRPFFDDETYQEKIHQIIQKGIQYLSNYQGGKATNENESTRLPNDDD